MLSNVLMLTLTKGSTGVYTALIRQSTLYYTPVYEMWGTGVIVMGFTVFGVEANASIVVNGSL